MITASRTRHLVTAAFVAVGLLNAYPVVGALGAARLEGLYGVPVGSADLELLLRHRAVLLALVGALLITAAWHVPLRVTALIAAFVSMGSFIALALPLSAQGPLVARVFWADVIGLLVLLAASVAMHRAR